MLYKQVTAATDDVVFRLPDLGSASEIPSLHPEPEVNPALGLRGVRLLLSRPDMLLVQLRAILRACEAQPVNISVPFVVDLDDLRAVRSAAKQAREELRLEGLEVSHPVQLGVDDARRVDEGRIVAQVVKGSCDRSNLHELQRFFQV